VTVNPKELSLLETERLSRGYMGAIYNFIGPEIDVPAPDVYTNSMIMGWMMDEYSKLNHAYTPSIITGKPLALGGSLGRDDATGRGGFYVLEGIKKRLGLGEKLRIAVQGFGNAGYHFSRLAAEAGHTIVAVSDSKGGIFKADGIDPNSVFKVKEETKELKAAYCKGSVCEIVDHEKISNEQLLELDVDVLVPAALEGVITEKNAKNIKAKCILELANGPTTFDADEILNGKGINVVPDILANSGGVTVSYFEWVQNRAGFYWEVEEVQERLKKRIVSAAVTVMDTHDEYKCSIRTAAYIAALKRINEGVKAQGTREYFMPPGAADNRQ
ncbi:MAG: Glu/Leu/Phe/Val dehydrogenase, partial [Bdellovibrionales bacterium]|nr:Glu/Leu/Phe/Val dehydrogenase [Bdellovibrionales bacterium]